MASHTSKTMIAPLQVSLDGFIEGPRGKGLSRFVGLRNFVVRREDYVCLVPFPPSPASCRRGLRRGLAIALRAEADVADEHRVFLKTIIPSRKATKQYFGEESDDHED